MTVYGLEYIYSGLENKTGSLILKNLPKDGNRAWRVTVPPSVEPVTVDELKEFSRISYDDEDDLLEAFISAARHATEEYLGKALIEQTIEMSMDFWPSNKIKLPRPPLISVTKVATVDEDDTETTYDSNNYYVRTRSMPGEIVIKQSITPPINSDRDYGGFLIEFKAGYGDSASDVPAGIVNGIKIWAASIYAMRELDAKKPPPEARAFLDLYRQGTMIVR